MRGPGSPGVLLRGLSAPPPAGAEMSHEAPGQSDDWYTPAYIFEALGCTFDLDVAAPPEGPRYVPCRDFIALPRDGLMEPWSGLVWMNPPFGQRNVGKRGWIERFGLHGNGIALLPDRTSAPWFQRFGPWADAILFVSPKVKFERPDGSVDEQPANGTALFAIGDLGVEALIRAGPKLGFLAAPFSGNAVERKG